MFPSKSRLFHTIALLLFLAGIPTNRADAQQVEIDTTRDSAMVDSNVNNNFGVNIHVPVGVANNNSIRRSLFFFDVAGAVPAGATVTNVTFQFDVTQQGGGLGHSPATYELRRLTSNWDEGSGDTFNGQANFDGCSWVDGEAMTPWNTPGGDFDSVQLGAVFVNNPAGNLATFDMGNADLISVTQDMLDNPATNFGFLMKNVDETLLGSAARITTREDNFPANGQAARLIIDFSMNADPIEVPASALNVFRGVLLAGGLPETTASDDQRVRLNPGFTISPFEAPVWLIFDANLSTDTPGALDISYEASAGTPGLTGTLEAFNWAANAYDIVDESNPIFNNDTVVSAPLTPSVYVEPATAAVRTRIGWRQTGFTITFPWEVRVDQVFWLEQ